MYLILNHVSHVLSLPHDFVLQAITISYPTMFLENFFQHRLPESNLPLHVTSPKKHWHLTCKVDPQKLGVGWKNETKLLCFSITELWQDFLKNQRKNFDKIVTKQNNQYNSYSIPI